MVEVVFHIGAHKSATTSVQRALATLAASRPTLLYVPPAREPTPLAPAEPCPELRAFVHLVGKKPSPDLTRAQVVEGLCRLIDANAGKERIVFSDEYLVGGMPGLSWRFYPQAHLAREVLDDVARRFRTSVLLQSRETAGYLRSCHQFRVRFGLTQSYVAFLERFDLGSTSWTKLGATLFEGADFAWRVLPIERLVDPAGVEETASAMRFVLPDWDLSEVPLEASNRSNGALMRAATLTLNRAGYRLDTRPRARLAKALDGVEAAIEQAEPRDANRLIVHALAGADILIDAALANVIRVQTDEERLSGGGLTQLLTERFAPDYAEFCARFARPAEAPKRFLFGLARS